MPFKIVFHRCWKSKLHRFLDYVRHFEVWDSQQASRIASTSSFFGRHELQLPRLLAKLGRFESVFDVEDCFACVDERQERLAFVELEALLVQRPTEVGDQVGYLVHVVLEADGQSPLVGLACRPYIEL